MERIKEKPTSVLVPIIDVIEAKNFYYSTNGYDTFQVSLSERRWREKLKLHQNQRASMLFIHAETWYLPEKRNRLKNERRSRKIFFAKNQKKILNPRGQCQFEFESEDSRSLNEKLGSIHYNVEVQQIPTETR